MIIINTEPGSTFYVVCLNDVKSKNILHCKEGKTYECKIINNYKDDKSENLYNALRIISNEKRCSHIIAIREDFDWDLDDWFNKNFKICS